MESPPQYIYVRCESRHRLKADAQLRGRRLACPKCKLPVVVPQLADKPSDTGVMRILGDISPLPPESNPGQLEQLRPCPRCGSNVRDDSSVCTHCQCFIGVSPDYLKVLEYDESMFAFLG